MKVSKMKAKLSLEKEVEVKLNQLALLLRVPFRVVVRRDASEKQEGALGETNIETRTIYINRFRDYEDARNTFLHEAVEALLNPSYKVLFTMLNAQNDLLSKLLKSQEELDIVNALQQRYVNEQFYATKEKAIEDVVHLFTRLIDYELFGGEEE
jgi:hypothetical protein